MNSIYGWFTKKEEGTIFYDFETTGLNQYHDKIIEYCFINFNGDKITTLIDPETKISDKIQRITKINNEMVEGKPKIWQDIPNIVSFIQNSFRFNYLIAHNGDNFDKIFLHTQLKKYDQNCLNYNWKHIDTLLLAKKLLPNQKSYSLKALLEHFKINLQNSHRAEDDTLALQSLYSELCKLISEEITIGSEELISTPSIVYNYLYL